MTSGGDERSRRIVAVCDWLAESGVREADDQTALSSLDLTWLLYCVEEEMGRALIFTDDALMRVKTVSDFVDLLDRQLPPQP